jgi:hypothetical protein
LRQYFKQGANEAKLGYGTGFFYRVEGMSFLITNWHVVTGRNPDQPSMLLPGYSTSPNSMAFEYAKKSDPGVLMSSVEIMLYDDAGNANWFEFDHELLIDLVVIPLDLPTDANVAAVQDFCQTPEATLEAGLDVIIVGFPFERSKDVPSPIWKRGLVASEPSWFVKGKPQVFLDSPGRAGMSGSPVYVPSEGFSPTAAESAALKGKAADIFSALDFDTLSARRTVTLEFAGIYAGTYGDADLDKLNLGRMISGAFLDQMLSGHKRRRGKNPYPPSPIDGA